MNRIVIINQDSGYLMIDLANGFAEAGHKVILVTGRLVQRNTSLHHSVILDKIIRYRRSNIMSKLITWLIAMLQILFRIWFKYSGDYLFIVSNPPMAPLIPLFCKNPYSFLIYDVYIEKPEQFKLFTSRSLSVRFWKNAHARVFKGADNVFTLTGGMAAAIEKYSDGKRCEVIPIWTDNEFLKPVPADKNPFITEYNLQKKFIVLYSGSIGESSGVDYLVEAASTIDNKNILFLIIGEGSKKQAIYKKIKVLGLDNCVLLPWQEVSVLPYSLASANLAVVTLSGKSSNHAIPSKLFNYMSVGSPILCLADPESDLGKLVTEEGIGKCFDPEMKREIAGFILQIFNNPEEARMFGNNALKASKKYTSDNVNRFLMSIK